MSINIARVFLYLFWDSFLTTTTTNMRKIWTYFSLGPEADEFLIDSRNEVGKQCKTISSILSFFDMNVYDELCSCEYETLIVNVWYEWICCVCMGWKSIAIAVSSFSFKFETLSIESMANHNLVNLRVSLKFHVVLRKCFVNLKVKTISFSVTQFISIGKIEWL